MLREEVLRGQYVYSTRTWRFVLVPGEAGDYELPAVEIPYFDPRRRRYQTASSASLKLHVFPVAEAATMNAEAEPQAAPTEPGSVADFLRPWLWLAVVPILIAAGTFWRRRRDQASGVAAARRQLLTRLDAAAAEERSRKAAAEMEEGWREFLAQRWEEGWDLPVAQWRADLGIDRGPADAQRPLSVPRPRIAVPAA